MYDVVFRFLHYYFISCISSLVIAFLFYFILFYLLDVSFYSSSFFSFSLAISSSVVVPLILILLLLFLFLLDPLRHSLTPLHYIFKTEWNTFNISSHASLRFMFLFSPRVRSRCGRHLSISLIAFPCLDAILR